MGSDGSSNIEKAKKALEEFEHYFSIEPLDEEDKVEAYAMKAAMYALVSIAESLDVIIKSPLMFKDGWRP